MMNPFRSEQSNERSAFSQNMNPMMRMKMMDMLKQLLPEEGLPSTFQDALKGGHFDSGRLNALMQMMKKRHMPEMRDRADGSFDAGLPVM